MKFQVVSEVTKKPAVQVIFQLILGVSMYKTIVRVSQFHFQYVFHFSLFFFGYSMIYIESINVTLCECDHKVT
jgi:hypothetical protein